MASNVGTIVNWMFNAADKPNDIYWKRMDINAELLCELSLQSTIRGDSRVYFCFKSISLYAIDFTRMTQTNLTSGRVRGICRTITPPPKHDLRFDVETVVSTPMPAFVQFKERQFVTDSRENKLWYDGIHYDKAPSEKKKKRDFVAKHCEPYASTRHQ